MRHAVVLFAVSLALRMAHWLLSPERADAFVADYQGDAPYWQQICNGTAGLEAALPFRPPGMRWLAEALWDGNGPAYAMRAVMTLLGALIPPALYLGLARSLEPRVALLAAWICACSNALIVLGSGLHVEIPHLLLCVLSIGDFERMRKPGATFAAARWGTLNAAACLFRAEHLAFVAMSLTWFAWRAWRLREGRARDIAFAAFAFAITLLPWQLHVARSIADFNEGRIDGTQQLPALPPRGSLPWNDDAIAAVRAMPAFAQLPTAGFVSDTVRVRGGSRVTIEDLAILDDAYGYRPEPLHTPLLALYGPLNFFLANDSESDGGFSRAALDRRPRLEGGLARFPRGLLDVLPRELSLGYPPHLDAVNHGYAKGMQWMVDHPIDAAMLFANKLALAWRGAATGFGLCNAPMGRSGTRMPVDLVTSESTIAIVWRWLLLALALIGLRGLRRSENSTQVVFWAGARLLLTLPFFGYARLGALAVPALAVLWATALMKPFAPANPTRSPRFLVAAAFLALLAAADAFTCHATTRPTVTGPNGTHARKSVDR